MIKKMDSKKARAKDTQEFGRRSPVLLSVPV